MRRGRVQVEEVGGVHQGRTLGNIGVDRHLVSDDRVAVNSDVQSRPREGLAADRCWRRRHTVDGCRAVHVGDASRKVVSDGSADDRGRAGVAGGDRVGDCRVQSNRGAVGRCSRLGQRRDGLSDLADLGRVTASTRCGGRISVSTRKTGNPGVVTRQRNRDAGRGRDRLVPRVRAVRGQAREVTGYGASDLVINGAQRTRDRSAGKGAIKPERNRQSGGARVQTGEVCRVGKRYRGLKRAHWGEKRGRRVIRGERRQVDLDVTDLVQVRTPRVSRSDLERRRPVDVGQGVRRRCASLHPVKPGAGHRSRGPVDIG